MIENTNWILFTVAVGVLLLILRFGIRPVRALLVVKQMTPLDTGEIVSGVFVVKNSYVNMYLVKGANGYIAIDSGTGADGVRKALRTIQINPAEVIAVFLTHGDTDHTGGLSVFQNATIYLGIEEEQMIDGRTARFGFFKNKPISKHDRLGDGQEMEVDGLKVKGISTPGHTPGSMCYRVDGRYLFVGDTMRLREGKVEIIGEAINMDSDTQRQSLKKLARLEGVQFIFTAHFGYTDSFARAFSTLRE
jgi:hydroxyacylglutathione hydrolase